MTREDWDPPRKPGGSVYTGVLLLLVGAAQVFIGNAVTSGAVFVFAGGGYWYRADNAGWGWVNLAVGLAAIVIGLGRFGRGRRLAKLRRHPTPALVVAAVSAMSQVFLAPQYPIFATLVIVLDVLLVWALATRPRPGACEGHDRIDR
ncbi:hypothetical protein [Glycomyces sp. NRRL B-16210]|uniref:DUF7144 family membrane protein n=1 Tax=Glycomyces sp. NRRL B-16210 TaxID=1463821 RepID=UPI0010600E47|nr:hypothetical protein [Glycomyces sp. NRRL B-16210]